MIIAIDGPAGAGKSTVARLVAQRLGIGYLNTGAMYRAVALLAQRHGTGAADGQGLTELARHYRIRLLQTASGDSVFIDDENVTDAVRAPGVTAMVSQVAAHGALRTEIVRQQREIMREGEWVADGRDIGSVVWPDADLKVFLTAEPEERARRRHRELVDGGDEVALGDVLQQIIERDHIDSTRAESPLVVAPGAILVDTTGREIDAVVDTITALAERSDS